NTLSTDMIICYAVAFDSNILLDFEQCVSNVCSLAMFKVPGYYFEWLVAIDVLLYTFSP
ncbi:hypothetical protein L9F63_000137, partial [Diploptera punctata]